VILRKSFLGSVSMVALLLAGCEMTQLGETPSVTGPVSSFRKNKPMHPDVARAFALLKEEKFSEASSFINQALLAQPKSAVLHILNAVTYEKLAELGDAKGSELAIIGYQNAVGIDPFNAFAITQLGKIQYREQQYGQAQEHFANALLLKPNDPDIMHEFAAASYYAYDLKSALSAIRQVEKLKPGDPLVQRSAAMIYAAAGDFKKAEKHFKLFQTKVGDDPEVEHVANRFHDWQSLYKSGRLFLAADQTTPQSADAGAPDAGNTDLSTKTAGEAGSSTADSASPGSTIGTSTGTGTNTGATDAGAAATPGTDSTAMDAGAAAIPSADPSAGAATPPPAEASAATAGPPDASAAASGAEGGLAADVTPQEQEDKPSFKAGELGKNIIDAPITPGVPAVAGAAPPAPRVVEASNPQIIMDCYILSIEEFARTSKGQNIMDNLAVTLNPGGYLRFAGSLWGSGARPIHPDASASGGDTQTFRPDAGFHADFITPTTSSSSTYSIGAAETSLSNAGSISGRIFSAGITWAGLTYSLNIANAGDERVEIVSRPTLTTFLQKEGQFFSGIELVNVSGGQWGSNLNRLPIGVGVAVTPTTINGDVVTLNIGIESSLLQGTNPNLLATVGITKTRVETTVKLRLGETVMLGGMYQRDETDSKNGFPGLRDIPILQYFFSHETTLSTRRSVAILLTPRSPDIMKSAVNRAMAREAVRPHFSELVSRNPDWFNPEVNAINIFSYISQDPILYYEFRTGDVLPPSWGYNVTLSDKLGELASFVYF